MHGGNPITHKGWLLYQDGYRYSRNNYGGPEVAPVGDEVRELGIIYWTERKKLVAAQVLQLSRQITYLLQEQSTRSAPLQETRQYVEDGKLVSLTGGIEIDQMQMRLTWLEEDMEACDIKIKELTEGVANERPQESFS